MAKLFVLSSLVFIIFALNSNLIKSAAPVSESDAFRTFQDSINSLMNQWCKLIEDYALTDTREKVKSDIHFFLNEGRQIDRGYRLSFEKLMEVSALKPVTTKVANSFLLTGVGTEFGPDNIMDEIDKALDLAKKNRVDACVLSTYVSAIYVVNYNSLSAAAKELLDLLLAIYLIESSIYRSRAYIV